MFGRKSALITHYEGEVVRLRQRIQELELANARLVDRLLAKNGVPDVMKPEAIPTRVEDLVGMDIFGDLDEEADNRKGERFDAFTG